MYKRQVVVPGVTNHVVQPLSVNIQITMIAAAALMIIFCKAMPKTTIGGAVLQNGMVAVIAIYGIAWMSDTFFSNYQTEIQTLLTDLVKTYPWPISYVYHFRLGMY